MIREGERQRNSDDLMRSFEYILANSAQWDSQYD